MPSLHPMSLNPISLVHWGEDLPLIDVYSPLDCEFVEDKAFLLFE